MLLVVHAVRGELGQFEEFVYPDRAPRARARAAAACPVPTCSRPRDVAAALLDRLRSVRSKAPRRAPSIASRLRTNVGIARVELRFEEPAWRIRSAPGRKPVS